MITMGRHVNENGVSVIVGTLLLILITVTAAAGLALMVSQMQKDEMNRQSHLTAVKNEQILVSGVTFESSPADWDRFFWPPNGTLNQSYSAVTFSLTNLNNEESRIIGISLNDKYPHNFTVIDDSATPIYIPYNFSYPAPLPYLVMPGSGGHKIRVNFTNDFFSIPHNIGQSDQVTIRVMTSLYNTFEKSFQPPNPVILSSTETQNLGSLRREDIVLDGSQSYAANNNSIVEWNWSVQDANSTIIQPGNCSDTQNLITSFYSGKIVHYQPTSPGPFCVRLSVRDNNGMGKTTDSVGIPRSDLFVPPSTFIATFNKTNSSSFIDVTVRDINGNPVDNGVVNYIISTDHFGNLTLDNYVGITGSIGVKGVNRTHVTTGIGSVKVVYGNFPPFEVAVWGDS